MINERVTLLPEQVQKYSEELEKLRQQLSFLTIQHKESKPLERFSGSYTADFSSDYSDTSLLMELSRISKRINEIEVLLASYDLVTDVNSDVIKVGTTFSFRLNNSKEMTLTLVEKFGDPVSGLISLDSPIGASVYGKTIGDNFTYKLFNGREASGTITNIFENTVEQAKEFKK